MASEKVEKEILKELKRMNENLERIAYALELLAVTYRQLNRKQLQKILKELKPQ